MNACSPAVDSTRAGFGHRLLGLLIITKAALPLALVALLALGAWQIASGISRAVDEARRTIEPQLALARARIEDVQAEGRRLLDEVKKIENATTQIAGAVKIRAVNGIPLVKDLPYLRLPDIQIPGIALPRLDIDVDLRPNLDAVRERRGGSGLVLTGPWPMRGHGLLTEVMSMNEETLNLSIRKFLKTVGVSSQREIEHAVAKAIAAGKIGGAQTLAATMTLRIAGLQLEVGFDGEIQLE